MSQSNMRRYILKVSLIEARATVLQMYCSYLEIYLDNIPSRLFPPPPLPRVLICPQPIVRYKKKNFALHPSIHPSNKRPSRVEKKQNLALTSRWDHFDDSSSPLSVRHLLCQTVLLFSDSINPSLWDRATLCGCEEVRNVGSEREIRSKKNGRHKKRLGGSIEKKREKPILEVSPDLQ